MSENWQIAMVVHSVPEAGWGLAETAEKKVIFFHGSKAIIFTGLLRGTELLTVKASFEESAITPKGSEIAFRGLIPAERGGKYPQAMCWTTKERFEEMRPSAEKAAATLARLAAENAEAERKRQELREKLDRLNAGKKQNTGGGKKGKKREKAGVA